jgi:hypothetical protein
MNESYRRAIWIQLYIEDHYGLPIDAFQLNELQDLATKLTEFVTLGVDTENLKEPEDYTPAQIKESGFKS